MGTSITTSRKTTAVVAAAIAAAAIGVSGWDAGAQTDLAASAKAVTVETTSLERAFELQTSARQAARLPSTKEARAEQAEAGELPGGRMLPVHDFRISAGWGHSSGPHAGREHAGLDMAADLNEPVFAAADGRVVSAGYAGGYGNMVKIRDDRGRFTMYAHLNKFSVTKGDKVAAGQRIGAVGSTGNSTGPHLHFEVHTKKDVATYPATYLGVATGAELTKVARDVQRAQR